MKLLVVGLLVVGLLALGGAVLTVATGMFVSAPVGHATFGSSVALCDAAHPDCDPPGGGGGTGG